MSSTMPSYVNQTAIAGYGATEFSKNSGRSELQLAIEATLAALEDAGIDPAEVDGMSTYTIDNNSEQEVFRGIGGRDLKFFSRTGGGGGAACAPFLQAALAISSDIANSASVAPTAWLPSRPSAFPRRRPSGARLRPARSRCSGSPAAAKAPTSRIPDRSAPTVTLPCTGR